MKSFAIASLIAIGLSAGPVHAQTTVPAGTTDNLAECQTNFMSADKNKDDMLDKSEIQAAMKVGPTTLGPKDSISKSDFLSACKATTTSTNK
jgi:hypothetical protein